jgi:hypothetical protein
VALVTTILGVVGVLGAIALLLWFSAVIEAKQLGPREPVPAPGDTMSVKVPAPAVMPAAPAGGPRPAPVGAVTGGPLGTAA